MSNFVKLCSNVVDETGHVHGWLTVLGPVRMAAGALRWLCRCRCGRTVTVSGNALRTGNSTSCGCRRRASAHRVHGVDQEREYAAWRGMIKRCLCPGAAHHDRYGGRGVRVCGRWRRSFRAFFDDVGPCPGPGWSLDRVDVDGDYAPGNVRWATQREQVRNRSNTVRVTLDGRTLTAAEWSELLDLRLGLIHDRLRRGLPPEKVLFPGNLRCFSERWWMDFFYRQKKVVANDHHF